MEVVTDNTMVIANVVLIIVLAIIAVIIDTKDIDEVEHDYTMNQQ